MAELRAAFESRYGRLGSGGSHVLIGGETLALAELMRRLGLDFDRSTHATGCRIPGFSKQLQLRAASH